MNDKDNDMMVEPGTLLIGGNLDGNLPETPSLVFTEFRLKLGEHVYAKLHWTIRGWTDDEVYARLDALCRRLTGKGLLDNGMFEHAESERPFGNYPPRQRRERKEMPEDGIIEIKAVVRKMTKASADGKYPSKPYLRLLGVEDGWEVSAWDNVVDSAKDVFPSNWRDFELDTREEIKSDSKFKVLAYCKKNDNGYWNVVKIEKTLK
jgi:hypothetical protein